MKSSLSLWALMCLISFCESMDRNRNKLCYSAMTCIHTGREKCGVDGGGTYRRFYDSCDLLEFNCLKGKDYVKAVHEKCQHLPPIDDEVKDGTGNNVNSKNDAANNDGIQGSLTINDNGDVEGEITINHDTEQSINRVNNDQTIQESPNNKNVKEDESGINQGNVDGIEGKIVIDEVGNIEGELAVNDDQVKNIQNQPGSNVGNTGNKNQQPMNQDGPAIEGEIRLDDEGNVEGHVKLNDENQGGNVQLNQALDINEGETAIDQGENVQLNEALDVNEGETVIDQGEHVQLNQAVDEETVADGPEVENDQPTAINEGQEKAE